MHRWNGKKLVKETKTDLEIYCLYEKYSLYIKVLNNLSYKKLTLLRKKRFT